MTCTEFENLILDQIDRRLSPQMTAFVEHHVATCETCQAFFHAAMEVDRSMADWACQPALPPQFTSSVLQRLTTPESRITRFVRPGIIWDFAALGAVAAAGAFCVWHLMPDFLTGGGWLAATVILCGGACLASTDPEFP